MGAGAPARVAVHVVLPQPAQLGTPIKLLKVKLKVPFAADVEVKFPVSTNEVRLVPGVKVTVNELLEIVRLVENAVVKLSVHPAPVTVPLTETDVTAPLETVKEIDLFWAVVPLQLPSYCACAGRAATANTQ